MGVPVTQMSRQGNFPFWRSKFFKSDLLRERTHMNAACHTYAWVISHMWMSHVAEEVTSIDSDVVKVQGGDPDTPGYLGCPGGQGEEGCRRFVFSIVSASPLARSWWNPHTVAVLYLFNKTKRFPRSRKNWRLDKSKFSQFFQYCLESPKNVQENSKYCRRLQISLRKLSDIGLMKQSNIHTWVMCYSLLWHGHVTHINKSCHAYECGMSHIWMSRVKHVDELCHTWIVCYGVAMTSRLLKIIGFFCKRAL